MADTFLHIVVLVLAGIASCFLMTYRKFRLVAAYGVSALALVVVAAHFFQSETDSRPVDIVSQGLAYGYMAPADDMQTTIITSETSTPRQSLPSVPAMITQLEKRLAREPEDAKGWRLLAQSYAYVGDNNEMETAMANAIKLGIPENVLRSQLAIVSSERR
jgi:hypothetical protein